MKNFTDHMTSGFDYQGCQITHPSYDETMRIEVNPIDYYGDDYIEYLHEGARYLMEDLDNKYNRDVQMSLDEYLCEFEFTEYEEFIIRDLLNRF